MAVGADKILTGFLQSQFLGLNIVLGKNPVFVEKIN
jgi:hypothetical protein